MCQLTFKKRFRSSLEGKHSLSSTRNKTCVSGECVYRYLASRSAKAGKNYINVLIIGLCDNVVGHYWSYEPGSIGSIFYIINDIHVSE